MNRAEIDKLVEELVHGRHVSPATGELDGTPEEIAETRFDAAEAVYARLARGESLAQVQAHYRQIAEKRRSIRERHKH